jgi:hypothetical protein
MQDYPEGYKGPKAGKSDDEEWLKVREYQAFLWVRDDTWSYADFDCYLASLNRDHYIKGTASAHKALSNKTNEFKITKQVYSHECGDGCCVETGLTWSVNGVKVHSGPCEDNALLDILAHLGVKAELVELDEDNEEIWSLSNFTETENKQTN